MRGNGHAPGTPGSTEQFGRYRFEGATGHVVLDAEEIAVTSREFALARLFFLNPGQTLSRAYLLEALWHCAPDMHTRTLDMHVSRIRAKLRLCPENGFRLQTIFGHGYRLETFGET